MADSHTLQGTQTIGIHDVLKSLQNIIGRFQTRSAICKFCDVTESVTAKKYNQRSLRDSTISQEVCVGEMLVLKAICDALTH